MSDEEYFGIDDDDTAFLAAATQIEAQQEEFEDSQRPSKRPRLDLDGSNSTSAYFQSSRTDVVANGRGTRAREDSQERENGVGESDEEDYYFPGELDRNAAAEEERKARLARFKIHIPRVGGILPSVFLTQTQHDLDEDPAAIRGPIWKKPGAKSLPPLFSDNGPRPVVVEAIIDEPEPEHQTLARNSMDAFLQRNGHSTNKQMPKKNPTAAAKQINRQKALPAAKTVLPGAMIAVNDQENIEHSIDLSNIPPDAFSSPEMTPAKNQPPRRLQDSQAPLKQMTIFGGPAVLDPSSTLAAPARQIRTLTRKDEQPTHHGLDPEALKTWTYPTNLGTIRDYQYSIVSRSLYTNTLVALPTGLGKTFIAATVMLNYYRWTTHAQIIFMAPTKPLIAQQMEACYGIVGIPRRDTVLMTGETTPAIRAEEWLERRVFFMTPQTVINDLKTGICDPKKVVLIVVDEAHKATGGYAYSEVVSFLRRFNQSFRVLALTATPGSTVEAVQAVIDNLGIARVELRTEHSIDIRQYTHEKHTDTQLFDWSEEQTMIMGHISKALQPVLDKLSSQNAFWSRDPMQLTPFGLQTARGKWMQSDAGRKAPMPIKGMINSIFTVLASLAHGLNLLKFHGIGPFYSTVRAFQKSIDDGQNNKKYARQIAESDGFSKATGYMRAWTNNVDFIGHPKMEYLREVIMNHFLDAGEGQTTTANPPRPTRVMIFSSFRDSTDEICRVLKRSEPLIRPHVFVGQSASKSSEGMDQKKQNAVIQDFKSGKYNTLVATSIGEEGLDIGDVDLIICYDASSSPIRMLQRIGRTGRKRLGRVVLLLMRGKEENDYLKAQDSYSYIQKTIADETKYVYRDSESSRIVPRDVQPVVDKRVVDIPVENSQPIDLNEKARKKKGKAKRPAKKFHMPDGVRTGFVKASKLGSDDEEEVEATSAKRRKIAISKKTKTHPAALPELAQMPFLDDVLLTDAEAAEHERRYLMTSKDDDDTIISAPDPASQPSLLRELGATKYLSHSGHAQLVSTTMRRVHYIDQSTIDRHEAVRHPLPTELRIAERARLAALPVTNASTVDTLSADEKVADTTTISNKPAQKRAPAKKTAQAKTATTTSRKRRTAGKKDGYGSDAMDGSESEPEPTPDHMRVATQGIELGSQDTSGEDDDESADSELDNFIVKSDAPVETLSSSLPGTQYIVTKAKPKPGRRLQKRRPVMAFSSSAEEDHDSHDEMTDDNSDAAETATRSKRGHMVINESDSDE